MSVPGNVGLHAAPGIELRHPTVSDAARMWRLVSQSPPLEINSCYAYLLLCRDFSDTCVVAEADGGLAGFVCGYRPPAAPDTVFVWQVAVGPLARRRGLGIALLAGLLAGTSRPTPRYLEATVTPSNEASLRLFRGLARDLRTACSESPGFSREAFGDGNHEEEISFRVGPIDPEMLLDLQRRLHTERSDNIDFHHRH